MALGYAVAQLVEALHYKPESRGFCSRWCHWNVSVTYKPSGRAMTLGLTQPLTQMSCRCLGLTILPPSRILIVLKSGNICLLEPSRFVQACNGFALPHYQIL